MSFEPVRVGVLGLGRSGYDIHLRTLRTLTDRFRPVAVADPLRARAEAVASELGIAAYDTVEALLADNAVELAVVATPNHLHAPHAVAALSAGKQVVCEKPFGVTVAQVNAMLSARQPGQVLAPFQNRRFEQSFRTLREVLRSGKLGQIHLIRTAWHGFGRRWDWQTLSAFEGGQVNNNLPHPMDQMMTLLEDMGIRSADELEVWADLRNALSSGDREDHVKVILRARGRKDIPVVEIEFTALCPYPQDNYLVMGSAGGLHGTPSRLEWKWVDWKTMDARTADPNPTPDRSYNREELTWHEESATGDESILEAQRRFYQEIYAAIREGAPLTVTPEAVRERIALLEKVRAAA